jgi:hypothetical protein
MRRKNEKKKNTSPSDYYGRSFFGGIGHVNSILRGQQNFPIGI